MTDTSDQLLPKKQSLKDGRFYKIPKGLVWGVIAMLTFWICYTFYDLWKHVDWPPTEQRNAELIKSLNCSKAGSYLVTKEMLTDNREAKSFQPVGIDRMLYVESPACASIGIYLSLEGSGVRTDFNVYDMTTKRKTANIVITHERFDFK